MEKLNYPTGPWEDNGNGLIYGQCSGEDDEAPFVADVYANPESSTSQERQNARLIAAAPELLKALEECSEMLQEMVCSGTTTDKLKALERFPFESSG